MEAPIVPLISYRDRPAVRLLMGTFVGLILFMSGSLRWGTLLLSALLILLLFLKKRRQSIEVAVWIIITGILFGWYSELRAKPMDMVPEGVTISNAMVEVLYPDINSAEGQEQYRAKIRVGEGRSFTVVLQTSSSNEISETYRFGGKFVAAIDMSSLSTIPNTSYRKYLMSQGYQARANIQKIQPLTLDRKPSLISLAREWRYRMIRKFDSEASELMPWQLRGLIYAISLGDRSLLSQSTKATFAQAGVAHILAVSGFHLGVVLGFITLLINRLLWRYQQRNIKWGLILLVLLFYTIFSGASVSTVRAFLMSALIIVARMLDRPSDPVQVLSLVFLIFLWSNPFSIYSVGLLLSLSAVWGIYSFLPLFRSIVKSQNRVLSRIADLIFVSFSAQIGVLPILLYAFGSFPVSFIWTNIPIVFVGSALIILSLIAFLLIATIGNIPDFYLVILKDLAETMHLISQLFSDSVPGFNFRFDGIAVLLYYVIVYLCYRLLHSYTCKLEEKRLVKRYV